MFLFASGCEKGQLTLRQDSNEGLALWTSPEAYAYANVQDFSLPESWKAAAVGFFDLVTAFVPFFRCVGAGHVADDAINRGEIHRSS